MGDFFSLWIPVIATVVAFLYLTFLGRFIPSFHDELLAVGVVIVLWVLYMLGNVLEFTFTSLFDKPLNILLLVVGVLFVVLVYKRYMPLKVRVKR